MCQRGDSPNARPVSRVCTSGAGDGFEGIVTSSGLGHGLGLIVENTQSRDFIAGRVVGYSDATVPKPQNS